MNNRYIERFRLPQRQYVPGAPVVLAAGVLLEDTKSLRLVAQLKWKNISSRPVSKISVVINTLSDEGTVLKSAYCVYEMDNIARGQSFGQKTAVPLQLSDGSAISVELTGVRFADGHVWKNEGGSWITLPEFELLELEPELDQFFHKNMQKGRYKYKQPADLWYCTCGGVNHMSETRCHRCRFSFANVSKYCDPVSLAALLQAKKDADAKRAEDIEKFKADAAAKISGFKAAAEKKVAEVAENREKAKAEKAKVKADKEAAVVDAAAAAVAVAAAESGETAAEPAVSEAFAAAPAGEAGAVPAKKKSKKGLIIGIAVLVVALVVAGVMFLPGMLGGGGGRRVNVDVSTPYDGEKFTIEFTENEDGNIIISKDDLLSEFPEGDSYCADGTAYLGDDLDAYLTQSTHMAYLIGSNGRHGTSELEQWMNPENLDPVYIFVFKDDTVLCGYGVGYFESLGNGKWSFEFTRCDYDITPLFNAEKGAFDIDMKAIDSIPEEAVADCGAAYYIKGYNMHTNGEEWNRAQLYNIWSIHNKDNTGYIRDFSGFEEDGPYETDDPVWTYYLLLDSNKDIIGYTLRTTYDSSMAGTYDISTPYDIEKVSYSVPMENESLKFELSALQEAFPEAGITGLELVNIPPVQTELEDYLRLSNYMIEMISQDTHSGTSQMAYTSIYNDAYALLLYGADMQLVGYSVGTPDLNASGTTDITVTLCDYDMTELYEVSKMELDAYPLYSMYDYIPYDIATGVMAESGEVAKALQGWSYNGSSEKEYIYSKNAAFFWTRLQFPQQFNYFLNDIGDISREQNLQLEENDHEQHILLFDENTKVIGYTIRNPHYE